MSESIGTSGDMITSLIDQRLLLSTLPTLRMSDMVALLAKTDQ